MAFSSLPQYHCDSVLCRILGHVEVPKCLNLLLCLLIILNAECLFRNYYDKSYETKRPRHGICVVRNF
jgi:hypothetical protein